MDVFVWVGVVPTSVLGDVALGLLSQGVGTLLALGIAFVVVAPWARWSHVVSPRAMAR